MPVPSPHTQILLAIFLFGEMNHERENCTPPCLTTLCGGAGGIWGSPDNEAGTQRRSNSQGVWCGSQGLREMVLEG